MLIYFLNVCAFVLLVVICALHGGARNERHVCAAQGFMVVVRILPFCLLAPLLHLHGSESCCHHVERIKLLCSLNLQTRHCSLLVSL